jgi:hypothetical protein
VRYKLLGRSGLRVSELCLGTMTFGEDWGWGAPPDECARIVAAFAEAGGNFIDSAHARRREQIEDSLGALELELSADELDRLDAVSRIELGFPHDFAGRALAYGDTYDLIDPPRPAVDRQLAMAARALEPTESGDGRPTWAERGGEASVVR